MTPGTILLTRQVTSEHSISGVWLRKESNDVETRRIEGEEATYGYARSEPSSSRQLDSLSLHSL